MELNQAIQKLIDENGVEVLIFVVTVTFISGVKTVPLARFMHLGVISKNLGIIYHIDIKSIQFS